MHNAITNYGQMIKHRVTIPCKRSFDFTWNPPDFIKSAWNLADFMKSSRFHVDFMWNPADFMKSLVIAPTLHSSNWRVFAETLAFIILGGFHRWNLGALCWISQVKSLVIVPTLHSSNWRVFAETLAFIILGGFHRCNLGELCWISQVKSTRFQGEIWWISWNPWS